LGCRREGLAHSLERDGNIDQRQQERRGAEMKTTEAKGRVL